MSGRTRSDRVVYASPAKVNLALEVKGQRDDGYHEIRTVFQAIDLADEVVVERRATGGIEVRCDHPGVPTDASNLVARAHAALARDHEVAPSYRIEIAKRVPPGGGLGGGSANAAAVIAAIDEIEGLGLGAGERERIAAEVGADAAFFVRGGAQLGTGRGEVLTPWPCLRATGFLLAIPPDGVRTADVYGAGGFTLTPEPDPFTLLSLEMTREDPEGVARALFNALEGPAFSLRPALGVLKGQILGIGAMGALLSGSGACVFGLHASVDAADDARARAGDGTGEAFGARLHIARPLDRGVHRIG